MIFLIAGEKGGVGKSTIATNLAVYLAHQGVDVVLLDTDGQATASRFVERRDEAGIMPSCRRGCRPTVRCQPRLGARYSEY